MLSDYTLENLSPSIAFQPALASISQQGPHLASSTLVSTGLQPVRLRRDLEWQPAPGLLCRDRPRLPRGRLRENPGGKLLWAWPCTCAR